VDQWREPAMAFVEESVPSGIADFERPFAESTTTSQADITRDECQVASDEIPAVSARRSPLTTRPFQIPLPVGALLFGEYLKRVNWRNRPADARPLLIGVPQPPGYADTVEAILSVLTRDDE
jgi:hypothetical protein